MKFSRFDVVIWSILAVLVAGVVMMVLVGQPAEAGLRVVFVMPDENGVNNLWLIDPQNSDAPEQLTFVTTTIHDYSVRTDGNFIAYAERIADAPNRNAEIKLLNMRTRTSQQLTNCVAEDADCTTPVFRPDGRMIAYQRTELNSALGLGVSPNRVWLLDINGDTVTNTPLIADSQVLGYTPKWSADGTKLAFYDTAQSGIYIYDFAATSAEDSAFALIPTNYGTVGDFSPDGEFMIFPEIQLGGPLVRATLQIADLNAGTFTTISESDLDDQEAVWSPDGQTLAVARRYIDDRITRGHQLFLYNVSDQTFSPLIYDERYLHSYFSWSPDGRYLLMNRFQVLTDDGESNSQGTLEIWIYDMQTGNFNQIVTNGYQPRWLP